jgi:DNA-binding MarR family transcriptional regulator
MSQQELLEIAEAVAGLVPRLVRELNSSEKDPADDLPLAQLRLCGILSEGPRPMSALSRALGVSHSALTQIADRLERARLVRRVAEGNDRRVRCLQLTPRGEKMMRKRREVRVLRTLAVLEPLAQQQREAVRSSLEILVDACSHTPADRAPCADGRQRPTGKHVPSGGEKTTTANGHASNPLAPARKRTT